MSWGALRRAIASRRVLWRRLARGLGWMGLGLVLVIGLVFWWVYRTDYPVEQLQRPTPTMRIVDRAGVPLRHLLREGGVRQHWVSLEQISPWVIEATLAGEDHRFHEHAGVDGWAILRAVVENGRQRRIYSGASTVTMQLARLLEPSLKPKHYTDKLRQAAQALRLEAALSKDEILEQYLNRAPYGNGVVGIEAASLLYFHKTARELSLAEAVFLSALPRSPVRYNPYTHEGVALQRRGHLLFLMRSRGVIDDAAYARALAQPLNVKPRSYPFAAPHFTQHVLQHTGATQGTPSRVEVTLDAGLQTQVEVTARLHLERLAETQTAAQAEAMQVAVVVVENRTGDVLAMLGSRDWGGAQGQVNAATALRQPGSTLKPFLYAHAFMHREPMGPATVLADVPSAFRMNAGETYLPKNFDGRFRGPVQTRRALAGSLNVPAVRALEVVGVAGFLERLRALGMTSLDQDASFYGLGLSLGSGSVTLVDLVGAYATLARGGVWRPLRWVRGRLGVSGEALPALAPAPARRVFSPQASFLVTDNLSDSRARASGFGSQTPFRFAYPVAVKTGTSAQARDTWTVGYTPQVTVGVWVGRFDGGPMSDLTGALGAGPLFRSVMEAAMAHRTPERFEEPGGLERVEVCGLSGLPAGEHCDHRTEELFIQGARPQRSCDWHREAQIDRRTGLLATPGCDAGSVETRRGLALPDEYHAWARREGRAQLPKETSPLCERGSTVGPRVVFPLSGEQRLLDPSTPIQYQTMRWVAQVNGGGEARWMLNGAPVELLHVQASDGHVEGRWPLQRGRHRLQMVAGGVASDEVVFEVR